MVRSFEANLELKDFDPQQFAGLEASSLGKNIRIMPRSECEASSGMTLNPDCIDGQKISLCLLSKTRVQLEKPPQIRKIAHL